MSAFLEVVRAGPLTTVQDLGRFGHRASGVSPSGAADLGALRRANALVGNPPGAAVLESTFGRAVVRVSVETTVAVTGATCPGVAMDAPLRLAAGATVELGPARSGLRAYLAVCGAIAGPAVLGSRSMDTLSGLGGGPVENGQRLPLGEMPRGADPDGEPLLPPPTPTGLPLLTVLRGPRDDWLDAAAWTTLLDGTWEVSPASNRVAVRLQGPRLAVRDSSLEPEPLVRGAVQVPPDGQPIIFLADHPVTGGYPVVAVLTAAACDVLAQCRPGAGLRFSS